MDDFIGDYIRSQGENVQEKLFQIYQIIKKAAPQASEKLSWAMPTFYLKGNLVHFAAHKNHIGLYPGAEAIVEFKKELEGYETSKGAIQLPYKDPLPKELITKIVKYRVEMANKIK